MRNKLFEFFIIVRNFLIDGLVRLTPPPTSTQKNILSVLIIRLDAIGDFILWLNAATELRKFYPSEQYRIVLFGNILWTDLAAHLSLFDEIIHVDKELLHYNFRYRIKMWRLIRNSNWAVAIHPTYSRDGNCGDAVIRMSDATERIGFTGDTSNQPLWYKWVSNRWYTKLVSSSADTIMELERNAEFIRNIGVKNFNSALPSLSIHPLLPMLFTADNYVVIVPGASLALKQWPVERFAELSKLIHENFGNTVVICGNKNEIELGSQLVELISDGNTRWVEDWTGKTSLSEFVAIIKGANMLIGNDSGAIHIAAAVGVQAYCVVGGGHYGRFIPYKFSQAVRGKLPIAIYHQLECYGCNLECTNLSNYRTGNCIMAVTTADVWEKISLINIDS